MNYQYPTGTQSNNVIPQNFPQPAATNMRPINYSTGSWNARIRPVSSIEEVRASPIDFDGSVFYFPDIANKCIYTKFINFDGTVGINIYGLKETPTGQAADSSYVTREEFDNAIIQLKAMYQAQLENNNQPLVTTAAPQSAPNQVLQF